jgi:hypothetical protein
MLRTFRAARFLVVGPLVLAMLFVINLVTSPHEWWVQWAALGMGIAWVICLLRVLKAVALVGGAAALGTYLFNRNRQAP